MMNKKGLIQLYIAEIVVGLILIIISVMLLLSLTASRFDEAKVQSEAYKVDFQTAKNLRTLSITPLTNYDSFAYGLNRYFELQQLNGRSQSQSLELSRLKNELVAFASLSETAFSHALPVGETYGLDARLYLNGEEQERLELVVFQGSYGDGRTNTDLGEGISIELPVYFSDISNSQSYEIKLQVVN